MNKVRRTQADSGTFMFCRAWSGPKPGHDHEQNQDAYEVRLGHSQAGGDSVLLAISDGASSTIYAGPWARSLVAEAQLDWPSLDDETLTTKMDAARERARAAYPADLPWYIAHKLTKEGSQATLLVASFKRAPHTDEVLIRTVAVGDSVLIVFRHDGSVASIPVSDSADFGLSPRLISTKPQPALRFDRWAGSLELGDIAVACTDAVGKWILQCVESSNSKSIFRLLLDVFDEYEIPEPNMRAAGDDLFSRLSERAGPRKFAEDDVTMVLLIPIRPDKTRVPGDLARATLEAHLSGDIERVSKPRPAWLARLTAVVRRIWRTLAGGREK